MKLITPLTMGSGLFVVISGLYMFFIDKGLFEDPHEIFGIVFAVAIILHVIKHMKPTQKYLKKPASLAVIIGLIGISGAMTSLNYFNQDTDFSPNQVYQTLEQAPLTDLAAIVQLSPQDLSRIIQEAGYQIPDNPQSLAHIADKNQISPFSLMKLAFGAVKSGT